jgi:hypothetical protein
MASSHEAQELSLATARKNGDYWSQREIDTLFQLFDAGFSLLQIAEGLERTYYSVTSMHHLGKKEASRLAGSSNRTANKRVLPYDKGQAFFSPDEW